MELKVEVTEGDKKTTYSVTTEPTTDAVKTAFESLNASVKSWLRKTVKVTTEKPIV